MCGIFGVINTKERIDKGRVLAARDILAHRGPDDAGVYFSPSLSHFDSPNPSSLALRYFDKLSTGSAQCDTSSDDTELRVKSGQAARDERTGGPFVALAHRRLSIIDLSPAGHQPMNTLDGRYTIVFNGEIYNYVELSQKSKSATADRFKSQKLRSNSDTGIILNLYAEYGKDCLSMLRGMFAFAIWDDKEKELFATRDRFGIKPFYYVKNDDEFIFSSELKAIKDYKKELTISKEGIDAFLRTGSVPAPLTIYNEVHSLLPGHYFQIQNSKLKIQKYWEFSDLFEKSSVLSPPQADQSSINAIEKDSRLHGNDKEESGNISSLDYARDDTSTSSVQAKLSMTNEERTRFDSSETRKGNLKDFSVASSFEMTNDGTQSLRGTKRRSNLKYDDDAKMKIKAALLDTIQAHMVADVEVGAFLSGGIDSTAIVSLMRQAGKEKIKTVSIVFPGNKLDESRYARIAAKKYNTEHIEIPFYEKDLLDDFENIMSSMDQPTIDGINTYFVSKAAKQAGLKVVLSGLGGDELFGGYPSFTKIPAYQKIKKLPFAKMFMKAAVPLLKRSLPAKAIEYFLNPDTENAEYKLVRGLFTDRELQSIGWDATIKNSKVKSQKVDENVISTNEERSNLKDFSVEDSFEMTRDAKPSALRLHTTNDQITINGKSHSYYSQCDTSTSSVQAQFRGISASSLQHISYLETCFYMRNQLLRDSDVFSMAHSLELRVPFVDDKLYGTVLPYLDDAFDKNFTKKMLVEAVGDIPAEIVHRPKMGFTFPFEDWIMQGRLKDLMIEKLKDLDKSLYIDHSTLYIKKAHWSRAWALFILSRYV